MRANLLRTIHLLALLQAQLYSLVQCWEILHILTLVLGDNLALLRLFLVILNILAMLRLHLLEARKACAPMTYNFRAVQIILLMILPLSIPVLWIFPLATLRICGYRIPYILVISKRLRTL